jgi:hypothetical protein
MTKVQDKGNENHDMEIKFELIFRERTFYDVINIHAEKLVKKIL